MDLISNPETEDDYEHNLKMMISNFNQEVNLVREGDIPGLVLFKFTLYQLLPHYVSSGTLEFRPLLSRSVIQGFEITNPSNAKLRYEGHHHRKRHFQVREQDNNSFTSSNCKLHD